MYSFNFKTISRKGIFGYIIGFPKIGSTNSIISMDITILYLDIPDSFSLYMCQLIYMSWIKP